MGRLTIIYIKKGSTIYIKLKAVDKYLCTYMVSCKKDQILRYSFELLKELGIQ